MNKTIRLKRFYKRIAPIIVVVSLIMSSIALTLGIVNYFGAKYSLRLEESWRDSVSRSWGDNDARPFRAPDKWAVSFHRESSLQVNIQLSVSVVLIKRNSTSESELVNVIGN